MIERQGGCVSCGLELHARQWPGLTPKAPKAGFHACACMRDLNWVPPGSYALNVFASCVELASVTSLVSRAKDVRLVNAKICSFFSSRNICLEYIQWCGCGLEVLMGYGPSGLFAAQQDS